MKLIKKIAAIMFAFMMVVSMSCNVKAEEEASPETTGTLTINGVKENQTYKLYKVLDLESFSGDNYSYKVAKGWEDFFSTGEGKNYISINENNYAEWKTNEDEATVRVFAQKALEYANSKTLTPVETITTSKDQTSITKTGLALGYYLLDSSVGTLCSLSSSQPNVTINEKNDVPSVDKKVYNGTDYVDSNNANIGDTIHFHTTIHVKKGAQSYVLHDVLSKGLKLNTDTTTLHGSPVYITDSDSYVLNKDNNNDYTFTETKDGFTITFTDSYLKSKEDKDYTLLVSYSATLTDAAVIGGEGNTNETYLKYGVDSESNHSTTTTYTFEIPVYKYTGTDENKQDLAGAKFKLYTNKDFTEANEVKVTEVGTNYFVGSTDAKKNVMTSPQSGRFEIKGLKAGTYYLKEIEAPKGYNLLANAVEIQITQDGKVNVKKGTKFEEVTEVGVENKSGTLLPSTGGAGTTMIYLVGALLVLGSGVVLASKRRSNSK